MRGFGERLRGERERCGVSLEEISQATKIGQTYLKALEANDFEQLPGGVFNRGFVRAYSEFIGVDPLPHLEAYIAEEQAFEQRVGRDREDVLEGLRRAVGERSPETDRPGGKGRAGLVAAITGCVVLTILGGTLVLRRNDSGPKSAASTPLPESTTPAGLPDGTAALPENTTPEGLPANTAPAGLPKSTAPAGLPEGTAAAPFARNATSEGFPASAAPAGLPERTAAAALTRNATPERPPVGMTGAGNPEDTATASRSESTAALAGLPDSTAPAALPETAANTTPASAVAARSAPPRDGETSGAQPRGDGLASQPVVEPAALAELWVDGFGVGSGVVDRQLQGQSEQFTEGSTVWFWTRVRGGEPGRRIVHVWSYRGSELSRIELPVSGSSWRTYSNQTLRVGRTGEWTVEARDDAGRVLARQPFLCVPGTR